MTLKTQEDRRAGRRVDLTTSCPVTFMYRGVKIEALLIELSSYGARMELSASPGSAKPFPGTEIKADIRTPYGPSKFEARVVWGQLQAERYLCGLCFTTLVDDPADSLRAFMESIF